MMTEIRNIGETGDIDGGRKDISSWEGTTKKNVDLCCLLNSKECCNNKTVCLDKDVQDNNKKRF